MANTDALEGDGSVEAVLERIASRAASAEDLDLWIPDELTLEGAPACTSIAMAIIGDALLARGFQPRGFAEGDGGRTYRYVREA